MEMSRLMNSGARLRSFGASRISEAEMSEFGEPNVSNFRNYLVQLLLSALSGRRRLPIGYPKGILLEITSTIWTAQHTLNKELCPCAHVCPSALVCVCGGE